MALLMKGIGKIIMLMESESFHIQAAMYMKETGFAIGLTVKVSTKARMEGFIEVNGSTISNMAKV